MTEYSFTPEWKEILAAKGITDPTPVQGKIIPLLQENKNVLFESETGTGKTLAFLIPSLDKIDASDNHVQMIIVEPTHELASQVKHEIQSVSGLTTALLIGGTSIKRQQDALKDKPQIVIGGPARLLELANLKKLKLDKLKVAVFDEVDRLLSPELRDETTGILAKTPEETQIVCCSATIKPKFANIISETKNFTPKQFVTETLPKEDVLRKRITHWAIFAEQRDKIDTLRKLLQAEEVEKALVFTSRADQVENIASKLNYKHIDCMSLYAKQDKMERKTAVDRFRSDKCRVLVTSDLAARGLDFSGITHIVQMDMPSNEDFFVHRAGRTARAGKIGINVVIGDAFEMRSLARTEKKLGFVVYPKEIHKGKVCEPYTEEEAVSVNEKTYASKKAGKSGKISAKKRPGQSGRKAGPNFKKDKY